VIWTIDDIRDLVPLVVPAGEPDQQVIAAYLARTRRPQHPPKHQGVKRYYYLLRDEPRVVFTCLSMPLEAWQGGVMAKVGTREIIGEFAGNRHLVGKKGSQLQFSPIAWLQGEADQHFLNASQALQELSFQILDLDRAERSQRAIARQYQWKKNKR
jgi:hypothetical protein